MRRLTISVQKSPISALVEQKRLVEGAGFQGSSHPHVELNVLVDRYIGMFIKVSAIFVSFDHQATHQSYNSILYYTQTFIKLLSPINYNSQTTLSFYLL